MLSVRLSAVVLAASRAESNPALIQLREQHIPARPTLPFVALVRRRGVTSSTT